ncbi:hypothetical protein ACFIJ5_03045 [Haloimpatiens sp. FM7330]|uniref:hypothetical protein n=1 Tax=Haloimpatiens sp. FM7330 TaxID=3298610 RepID=UPI003627D192
MAHRKVIENYYCDINNLTDLITKLVNSYRLLVGGADELNKIALAEKKDIKKALNRAEDLGEIIDNLICILDKISCNYIQYCNIKAKIIQGKVQTDYILTEIDQELKLKE